MTIIVVSIASMTTLNVNLKLKTRLINLSILVGCTFGMTNYMVLTLVESKDALEAHKQEYYSIIGSFCLGWLLSRAAIW